jgi:hypothetical protein
VVVQISWKFVRKYDKQDQQGKAAFSERNPTRLRNKNQRQGAKENPKQKQGRAKDKACTGLLLN